MTVAYNNRDHRKTLVIDGQISYTGRDSILQMNINRLNVLATRKS